MSQHKIELFPQGNILSLVVKGCRYCCHEDQDIQYIQLINLSRKREQYKDDTRSRRAARFETVQIRETLHTLVFFGWWNIPGIN